MNIVRVNIGVLTGWKKIKQRRISFVLGYLRMILTQKGGFSKLCLKNKKKDVIPTNSIFQHVSII
jgi:hypothetical protein